MYSKGFKYVIPNAVNAEDNPDNFQISKYLKMLEEAFENDTENLVEKFRGIYALKVKDGPNGVKGCWIINAKEGRGKVVYNGTDKPDVTVTISDGVIVDLISGKLNPQKAFFQGKVKIQGKMGLAVKLTDLQKHAPAGIGAVRSKL